MYINLFLTILFAVILGVYLGNHLGGIVKKGYSFLRVCFIIGKFIFIPLIVAVIAYFVLQSAIKYNWALGVSLLVVYWIGVVWWENKDKGGFRKIINDIKNDIKDFLHSSFFRWLIKLVVFEIILVGIGVLIVMWMLNRPSRIITNTTPTNKQLNEPIKSLEPIAVRENTSVQAVTLPLTILSSSPDMWEGSHIPTPITPPKSVIVNIPANFMNEFNAFTIISYNELYPILLAPKGWTGEGSAAIDGNTGITLYPPGTTKSHRPYIEYEIIPNCISCFYSNAAFFFPGAMTEIENDPTLSYVHVLDKIPGYQQIDVSPTVVSYSYPITQDGIEIYGLVSIQMKNNHSALPFKKFEVGIQTGQRDIGETLLNYYYQTYFNK